MCKKIAVITHCETHLQEKFGMNKMINSLRFFNPDFDIYVYDENDLNRIYKENPGFNLWSIMPITMKEIKQKSKCDIIIHIDSDSLVLDKLTEILEEGYDVFGVRNDPDIIGDRDESMNRPHEIRDMPNHMYLNCGFIATSNDDFLEEWISLNRRIIDILGDIRKFPIAEQGSYNLLTYKYKYKVKILDPKGGNLFYGPSANYRIENCYEPEEIIKEYGANNWGSWKNIKYDSGFYLDGKKVKVLHQAGGGTRKLLFDLFNSETRKIISEISKYKE